MHVEDIIVGKRHRTDLGDMEALKWSISEIGLLQPIVVRKGTNELVAGFRRLNALKDLGITELARGVHFNLIDIESVIRGEHDENICRQDFTISEKVAIFEAMKEEEKRHGIARQINRQSKPVSSGRSAEGELPGSKRMIGPNSSARSYAASAVGMHYNTLRKAAEIVAAARKDPVRYDPLVKEMDSSGKVEPVFQKFVTERSRPAPQEHGVSTSLSRLACDGNSSLPEFMIDALSRVPPARQENFLNEYDDILRTVKRGDVEESVKAVSKGRDIGTLSEDDIIQLAGYILRHAAACSREWIFLPQVRQVAAVMMRVARSREPVSVLDRLDFFMIGLAGFVDMACSYLQVANKDGILKDIPPDALEKYLAAIEAFQMLYESKLPRQVGVLCRESDPGTGMGVPTIRDHANAMKANEMITNAAEGSIPYYRSLIAGLIENFRKGAQNLEAEHVP